MANEYLKGKATVWPEDEKQFPQTVYFVPPKTQKYDASWLILWQDRSDIGVSMVEQAEMENPLSQSEYRVRDWLLGTIGIGHCVHVNQSEVARALRMHPVTVCNAIKRLLELGILLPGPKSGRCNTYTVNPAFCFQGKIGVGVKERRAKIIEFKKEQEEKRQLVQNNMIDGQPPVLLDEE